MARRLQAAAAAATYGTSMMMNLLATGRTPGALGREAYPTASGCCIRAAAVLVLTGCAGPEKAEPGPARDSLADTGDEASWSVFVPTEGEPPGMHDTDGPMLWVIADDAAAKSSGHSDHLLVQGAGRILEDGTRFEGGIDYLYEVDDQVVCDARIALSGARAEETICEDCDYLFAVDPELVEDEGLDTCDIYSFWAMMSDGLFVNWHLGFAPTYFTYNAAGWGDIYDNVMLIGWGLDYRTSGGRGYYPGPYLYPMVFEGRYGARGWLEHDDTSLSWGYERSREDINVRNHWITCEPRQWRGHRGYLEGTKVSGTVDCGGSLEDGWGFEAEAGDVLTVSVDAPDLDTYFGPYLFVFGPDGCGVVAAAANYTCSSLVSIGSTGYVCSAARFVAPETGVYEIWLYSSGWLCSPGIDVNYDLYVDRIGHQSAF